MTNTLTLYELWQDGDSLAFFPQDAQTIRATLGPDARLVWSCRAASWTEAQTRKHEHLGWAPYVPFPD